ncbi:MAG: phytoene desaturase family protein [Syntrophomonadaceae bacterium]
MARKTVIIIGAGLAGLSAGCYAQMNGYNSIILEHHSKAGGVAAYWRRKDYLIDGGIHFIMGYKPGTALYEMFCQLGLLPACELVEMGDYGVLIDENNVLRLEIDGDLNNLTQNLLNIAPADEARIQDLLNGVQAMQGIDLSTVGMSKPPELTGVFDGFNDMWKMRRVMKYFSGSYNYSIAQWGQQNIKSPLLRQILNRLFLPEAPVWFIIMLLALLANRELAYLAGGCREFVSLIEQRYLSLEGRICFNCRVDKIIVENDRAAGVRLKDGCEYRADYIISAADGHSTIFHMLDGKYVDKEIVSRFEHWPLCRPLVMVSYGVRREFRGDAPFQMIEIQEPLWEGDQAVSSLMLRIFNYSSRFAPPGKTVVQAEYDSDWDFWNNLYRENRDEYNREKERLAGEILERLEKYYPGISGLVEVVDVATPVTTWRYTGNYRGSWGGWLLTPANVSKAVKRTLPGLRDFYMAGQWVMPGGGVPTSLYSGRHAIQLLCHRDGKKFCGGLY